MKHLKKFNEMSNEKLTYDEFVDKFFDKEGKWWISRYEREIVGFAPSDLSHYTKGDLKEEYKMYLDDSFEDEEQTEFYNDED